MVTEAAEDGPELTPYEAAAWAVAAYLFYLVVQVVAAAISSAFGPAGLPLLTLSLVLAIHFLSTGRGGAMSEGSSGAAGSPDAIYRLAGSPVGVALLLLLLLLLVLHAGGSLFGSGGDDAAG